MSPKAPRPVCGDRAAVIERHVEHCLDSRSRIANQDPAIDLADVRFQRAVAQLHRLGPRSLYEMLAELGAQRLIRSGIEDLVERYVDRLTPERLLVIGGDKFPPAPVHVVGGRQ
jgi:hypothetical protein